MTLLPVLSVASLKPGDKVRFEQPFPATDEFRLASSPEHIISPGTEGEVLAVHAEYEHAVVLVCHPTEGPLTTLVHDIASKRTRDLRNRTDAIVKISQETT